MRKDLVREGRGQGWRSACSVRVVDIPAPRLGDAGQPGDNMGVLLDHGPYLGKTSGGVKR